MRLSVVGTSGSGKTTVARRLAGTLGAPYLELDSLRHQPGWQELPDEEFRSRVEDFTAGDEWVVDGNYTVIRDAVWPRADTVVWLDVPRRVATWRVASRSLRRVVLRTELWNGNRESLRNLLSRDPYRNIILWSWTTHDRRRRQYTQAMDDPRWAHIEFVRLARRGEISDFLERFDA